MRNIAVQRVNGIYYNTFKSHLLLEVLCVSALRLPLFDQESYLNNQHEVTQSSSDNELLPRI